MSRTLRARLRAPNTVSLPFTATARRISRVAAAVGAAGLILFTPAAAHAEPATMTVAANSLPQVISNLQGWIMGILGSVATLFLVLSGVYRATAAGDPTQVEKAKIAFKNALIGYGLAVLSPVLLQVVRGIVGG